MADEVGLGKAIEAGLVIAQSCAGLDSKAAPLSLKNPLVPLFRVALYARVSTLNNQDPEMQLAELREYAARPGGR